MPATPYKAPTTEAELELALIRLVTEAPGDCPSGQALDINDVERVSPLDDTATLHGFRLLLTNGHGFRIRIERVPPPDIEEA